MVVEDKKYEACFQIIMAAGDARSKAIQAIKLANENKSQEAEAMIKEAKIDLKNAHVAQTQMLRQEAEGKEVDVNIILVHSQDHFSMAMTAIDMAEEVIILTKRLSVLEQKL